MDWSCSPKRSGGAAVNGRPMLQQDLKICSLWESHAGISSGRTASGGRDPMLEKGKRVKMEEQQRENLVE